MGVARSAGVWRWGADSSFAAPSAARGTRQHEKLQLSPRLGAIPTGARYNPTMSETHISPKDATSPSNGADREEDELWSGEDEDGDDPRKRKRQRTSRPVSVSCERCKERKVGNASPSIPSLPWRQPPNACKWRPVGRARPRLVSHTTSPIRALFAHLLWVHRY